MELPEIMQSNILLMISSIICLLTFFLRIPHLFSVKQFVYDYYAKTQYSDQDHHYRFTVQRIDAEYRCYIESTPSFRNRDTSHYLPHYWIEEGTKRHFICWTGKIKYPEQAKTLCRNWSDATQQFIDTGNPAPGFKEGA